MSDITERLRHTRRDGCWCADKPKRAHLLHPTCQEAADEIDRLRAENAALRGNPGLPDDWVCDDHGTFGCRKCMSPIQLAALGDQP